MKSPIVEIKNKDFYINGEYYSSIGHQKPTTVALSYTNGTYTNIMSREEYYFTVCPSNNPWESGLIIARSLESLTDLVKEQFLSEFQSE